MTFNPFDNTCRIFFDDKRFEVVGVVTMPDAPSGRGMEMHENIIKVESKKLRIMYKGVGNTKIKFLLLHGWWGDGTENRFDWLKHELEAQ